MPKSGNDRKRGIFGNKAILTIFILTFFFIFTIGVVIEFWGKGEIKKFLSLIEPSNKTKKKQQTGVWKPVNRVTKKIILPGSIEEKALPEKAKRAIQISKREKTPSSKLNEINENSLSPRETVVKKSSRYSTINVPKKNQVAGTDKSIGANGNLKKQKLDVKKQYSSHPYSISLGSFRGIERRNKSMATYGNKGLMTYYVRVDLGEKGIWYRVYGGYFRTRKEADELIKTKQIKKAVSRYTKYANLIGIYNSKEELARESMLLHKKEYSPYVIVDEGGVSFLYVGAFYQKARAEKQNAELLSHGIQAQLVER